MKRIKTDLREEGGGGGGGYNIAPSYFLEREWSGEYRPSSTQQSKVAFHPLFHECISSDP